MFAAKPDIIVLGPDPAIDPGLIVQLPEGKPVNNTLPVGTAQVGCVIVPTAGAAGAWLKVILTSSVDAVHGPLLMVHLNTYAVPAIPVNVLTGFAGVVTVPPKPLTILHAPVPTNGVFPASVAVVKPHIADPV